MIAEKCRPIMLYVVAAEKRQNSCLGITHINTDIHQANPGKKNSNRRICRFLAPRDDEPNKRNKHLHDRSPKDVQLLTENSKKEVPCFVDVEDKEMSEP